MSVCLYHGVAVWPAKMAVSVLAGQVTRTWNYTGPHGLHHVITLYHDPLTGVRSATLDHEEIVGSLGTSSILMERAGHRILFSVKGVPGFIEIKRIGWVNFDYICNVGGTKLPELTEKINTDTQHEELYDVKIAEHRAGSDGYSEDIITWYLVECTRISDGQTNTVHRRFKDFVSLNDDVRENFRGHQLFNSLPIFPQKKLKLVTDHTDPVFLTQRESQLQAYLSALMRIPHAVELTSVKAFIGLVDNVRETSILFTSPTLGMTLLPSETPGSPAVIGFIQNPMTCPNLLPGDIISRINGNSTSNLTFQGVVRMLKHLPRPIVVHFIQTLAAPETEASREMKAKRRQTWKGDTNSSPKPLPSFSGDHMSSDELATLASAVRSPHSPPTHPIVEESKSTPLRTDGEYVSFA